MKKPIVEKCGLENLAELCMITQEFIEESYWGFTYDHGVVFNQMVGFLSNEEKSAVFIVRIDDVVAGGAICLANQDLCKEKLGYIHKFYIRPEYRKTLAARSLAKECTKWLDEKECFISFVTDTGNIHENGLICVFKNLMGKCGYLPSGSTLYRIQGNNEQAISNFKRTGAGIGISGTCRDYH